MGDTGRFTGRDTITDFQRTDVLDLSDYLVGNVGRFVGTNPFTYDGSVQVGQYTEGANTIVLFFAPTCSPTDGVVGEIELTGIHTLTAANFIW